jgi:hypothetical protein
VSEPTRRHPVRNPVLLTCLFLFLLVDTASLVNPVVAVILWVPPFGTYFLGKLPGERAKVLHDHMLEAIGTAIGAAICLLVIWGLLLGGGNCVGWGCG